jgi:hypothetical protein
MVGSDAATRNDAMEVWMMMQILSPGMEHRYEADSRTQMFAVGGDLQEGFGCGAKEHAVNCPLVLKSQGSEHLRQLSSTLVEPCRAGGALTLWAMTITAGTIRDRAVSAMVALLDVATERSGTTDCDVPQRFPLANGERSAIGIEISWTVDAENIGQFQRGRGHGAGIGSA